MKDLKKEMLKDKLDTIICHNKARNAVDEVLSLILKNNRAIVKKARLQERKKTLEEVMGLITEEINYSELKLYEGDRQHEGIKATLELIVDKILSKLKSKGE